MPLPSAQDVPHMKSIAISTAILWISALPSSWAGEIDGVWQSINNSDHYFAIREKDGRIVLIDLARVATSGDTMTGSYVGETTDNILTRLSGPGGDIFFQQQLELTSATTGIIYPLCDTCSVVGISIQKVF